MQTEKAKKAVTPTIAIVALLTSGFKLGSDLLDNYKQKNDQNIAITAESLKVLDDRLRDMEKEIYHLLKEQERKDRMSIMGLLNLKEEKREMPRATMKPSPPIKLPVQQKAE